LWLRKKRPTQEDEEEQQTSAPSAKVVLLGCFLIHDEAIIDPKG
jgi:hypothetical protein